MKNLLIIVAVLIALFTAACSSDSDDVASLETSDTQAAAAQDTAENSVEAAWLDYAQCLRDNGLAVSDPVVDGKGIVQKPEPVGETQLGKEKLNDAYEVCGKLLEGVTFEKEDSFSAEYIDGLLELAQCLRNQGIEVDDPDASAEKPGLNLGETIKKDWDSPAMLKAREVCDVEAAFGGTK